MKLNNSSILLFSIIVTILFSTSVFAQEWIKQDSSANGYDLYDVHAVDQERVWAVGGGIPGPGALGGVIMKTVNGGDTWENALVHEEPLFGLCFFAGVKGIAVGDFDTALPSGGAGPTILSTTNGGSTWPQRNPDSDGLSLTDVECTNDGRTAFAVGGLANDPAPGFSIEAQVLKSTDSGVSWTHLDSNINDEMYDAFFLDPTHGYLVGSAGKVYRTTNGASFSLAATLTAASGIALALSEINCLDMDNCWVTTGGEVVYHTTNGFESYDRVDTGEAVSGMADVNAIDEDLVWVTGQSQIRHTPDGGDTWEVDSSDISTAPYHLLPVNMIKDADFVRQANGDLVGWAVGDIHDTLRRGTDGLVGPDAQPGLVLRYGAPFRCPAVDLSLPEECVWPNIPMPSTDENNCPGPYVCEDPRDECDLAYEECTAPASEAISECLDTTGTSTCYEQYEEDVQPCEDAFNVCSGVAVGTTETPGDEEDEDDEGGIGPNSPWWWFEINIVEPITLASLQGKDEKAKKKLLFADERLAELLSMAKQNDSESAEKAKEKYEKTLKDVKEDISKIDDSDKVIEVEKKVLLHQEKADGLLRKFKLKLDFQAKTITEQDETIKKQQLLIEELQSKLKGQTGSVELEVKKKLKETGEEDKLGRLKQEKLARARYSQVKQDYTDFFNKMSYYEKEHFAIVAEAVAETEGYDAVLNKEIPNNLQSGEYGKVIADANRLAEMLRKAYKVFESRLFAEDEKNRAEAELAKKKADDEARKARLEADRLKKLADEKARLTNDLEKKKAADDADRAQKIADEKKRLAEEASKKKDDAKRAEDSAKEEFYKKDYAATQPTAVEKSTKTIEPTSTTTKTTTSSSTSTSSGTSKDGSTSSTSTYKK